MMTPGIVWQELPVDVSGGVLRVGPHVVMDERERLIMVAFARAARYKRSILEIGYGLGILSEELHCSTPCNSRRYCPERHVIVEAHPIIAENARKRWDKSNRVKVVEGWWQDVVPTMPDESFDAVLHDWYMARADDGGKVFAEHAARLLRPNGVYIPWSTEAYTYDAVELAVLLKHFAEVKLVRVTCVPCETRAEPQIVIAVCRKGV